MDYAPPAPRNRTPLIVVGVLVIAALIGGGVWLGLALTGDDKDASAGQDPVEVATKYVEEVFTISPEDTSNFDRAQLLSCEGSPARTQLAETQQTTKEYIAQFKTTSSVQQPLTTAIVRDEPGRETVVRVSGAIIGHSELSPEKTTQQFTVDVTVAAQQPRCVSSLESVLGT